MQTGLTRSLFETDLGWVGAAFRGLRLRRLTLPRPTLAAAQRELEDLGAFEAAPAARARLVMELVEAYAAGDRVDFSGLVVDWEGYPAFWQLAWSAIRGIPYAQTATYGEVAALAGRPRAARAVGTACAHNPTPFVVPCHRVVAADGVGGYGGREQLKVRLLHLEGVAVDARGRIIRPEAAAASIPGAGL